MSVLSLVIRALAALADGDLELVLACLQEAETVLRAEENRWVDLSEGSLVADMSVFDDPGPSS